jgi:N-glycosylase/DNA lyase
VKRPVIPVTIDNIRREHHARRREIRRRLNEFSNIGRGATDENLWAEMVYCLFTGGCSARMGLNALDATRPLLMTADREQLAGRLKGVHRYPNARARYVVETREFLHRDCGFRLRDRLEGFACPQERRDWLVREKGIKGLGYKEASHYLRNIGFKGYAILDKHVLRCLAELKIIDDPKPPSTRQAYLTVEDKLRTLSERVRIDFDALDLVLWSMKTGVVLK